MRTKKNDMFIKEHQMKFSINEHDYVESDEEKKNGHIDTRQHNFKCDNPDRSLGCDLGIDVPG